VTQVEGLLRERNALTTRLSELDAKRERVARAVQRVGGPSAAGRPFTGAHPLRISDVAELDAQLAGRNAEMKELTASISKHELALLRLDQPSRSRWWAFVAVLVVLAGVAGSIYLAVR